MGWRRDCTWILELSGFRVVTMEEATSAAYCDHPVRFGVVESINTTIKTVLRRARGMPDEEMLLLKLKWATAHPIRLARDLARFLTVQPLYSNQ